MVTPLGQSLGITVLSTIFHPSVCFFKNSVINFFKPIIMKHD